MDFVNLKFMKRANDRYTLILDITIIAVFFFYTIYITVYENNFDLDTTLFGGFTKDNLLSLGVSLNSIIV